MTALEALNLAAPLADTYTEVEQRLLVKIARQLTLNDTHDLNEVSKWQIKQLAQMGMLKKDAAKIINSMTKGLPADYADTVQVAIEATLAEDGLTSMWENEEFSESAKKAVKHYRNQAADVYNQVNTVMQYKAGSSYVRAVNSVAEKMTEEMRRLQKEIGNKQDFLDTLNSNTAAVVSGTTARTKAVRDTIHEMAQKGIPAFVDKLGREWSPEAYVNMDIRNTVKNTATSAAFGAMDALDQDVFEVSSHPGSRPKCRPWQGKFISRSGRTTEITDLNGRKYKVYPLSQTSYGEPDGLFGINCGHRPRGVSDGLFTRTSKTSEEYGSDDEELYYKVCKQRELERKVRRSKTEADMLDAAGDSEGARAVRQKANQYNKDLKGFCQQNGLKYRTDRVRTYGAVEPKKTATGSSKKLDKPLTFVSSGDTIKPYEIPITRQEIKDMVKRSNSLKKPIFAEDRPDNKFASYASLIKSDPDKYDVAMHGADTSAEFFSKSIDAYTLAKIIKSRPDYKVGTPVRLLSCNTGNTTNTGNCFAQILANELHTTVWAPTKVLLVNPDGSFEIGQYSEGELKPFTWRE